MNPIIADMVQTQFRCGMRPQDVINLRMADVDRSREVWLFQPPEHKMDYTGAELTKAIPPSVQQILAKYAHRPDDLPVFSPKDSMKNQMRAGYDKRPRPVKVRSGVREAWTNQTYYSAVRYGVNRAIASGAEIPRWTPNQLRHGVATLIRERYGADKAQAYLGHESLDTTAIYADVDIRTITDLALTLDRDLA